DRGNFVKQLRCGVFRKNERLMLPREFVGQLFTSANVAGFDQRQPLPGLAEPGIVIFHAFERTGERAGRTLGSQPQVGSEQGRLPLNTIFRPSCPRAMTPLPARAKRCASFLVLSTSVRRGNFQPELISSCWTTLPAFAAARGRTSKFRGALATEEARGRAAIVPRKFAKPPEGESALLRREGNRARNPEANRPSRQQSRSAPFQLGPD